MGDNNTRITLAISGVDNGQRAIHIDGELSHHIDEGEVATLLTEARRNLWRHGPDAGARLGRQTV
ncbi:MAG: hypothetical protein HQL03_06045 [Nitrospirae bacterium]|nr:hypothetical protein [Nitrospirota bacterium]MBF0592507.1 hypothetical protein [Nitrospirota bacterium]